MKIEVPVRGVRGFHGSLFVSLDFAVDGTVVGEVCISHGSPVAVNGVAFHSFMQAVDYVGGRFRFKPHAHGLRPRRADWNDVSKSAVDAFYKAAGYVVEQLNDADSPAGRQVGSLLAARTETVCVSQLAFLQRELADLDQQRERLLDQMQGYHMLSDALVGVGDVSRATFETVAGVAAGLLDSGVHVQVAWAAAWDVAGVS